jgi:DNA-binding GntR family transcriptional regulator
MEKSLYALDDSIARVNQQPAKLTLADQTYHRLRRDIVDGRFAPSSRLHLAGLCRRYGVGMSPVREALARLSSEGFAIALSQRGFRVSPLNLEDLKDLTIAREKLEAEALRLSIENADESWRQGVTTSFDRLGRLDRALADRAAEIIDQWELANGDFHRALVAACPSQWLLRMRELLYGQSQRYRRFSVIRSANIRRAHEEHRSIMEAALDRNAERACDLIRAHVLTTSQTVLEALSAEAEERVS